MIRVGTYMAHLKLVNYLILLEINGGGGGSRTRMHDFTARQNFV